MQELRLGVWRRCGLGRGGKCEQGYGAGRGNECVSVSVGMDVGVGLVIARKW